MSGIDITNLLNTMLEAAVAGLAEKAEFAADYASAEFQKIAQCIAFIDAQHLAGRMSQKKARLHFAMQTNAAKTVLLTLEGLGILAVEDAINAALKSIRDLVNDILGFILI